MIQLVIVGIDSQKQTPKVVNLGILKLHALSWEDVIEETVQKLILIKLSFSLLIKPKHDMTQMVHIYHHEGATKEKMRTVGLDEIPEDLSVEKFVSFDVIGSTIKPILPDSLIMSMTKTNNFKEKQLSHGADEWLEKPTAMMSSRSAIKTSSLI